MAEKTRGELIKEARTAAKLTQEKLANEVGVVSSDISKAERGDIDLTDAVLKKIAKVTGVTQASLLNAPMGGTKTVASTAKSTTKTAAGSKTAAAKSTGTKASTAKTTSTKTTAAKTTVPANADVSMKVTSAEKKLIEAYRAATSDNKKAALKVLKGECNDLVATLLGTSGNAMANSVADLLGDALSSLLGGK